MLQLVARVARVSTARGSDAINVDRFHLCVARELIHESIALVDAAKNFSTIE
jgi:hypothetical protein